MNIDGRFFLGAIMFMTIGWLTLILVSDHVFGFDRVQDLKFKTIRTGMPEDAVTGRLGDPFSRTNVFFIGQREGFEGVYEAADQSDSTYFLSWRNGIDFVHTVGLDSESNVAFKACGGT